jgi:hypothetical protein
MKKYKIMFWVSTTLIFLFEGVMTALTSHTEMAVQGITSLGYPVYFGTMLAVFKVAGSIVLIVPKFPRRVKEWAYAGFGIDFISAFVSLWVVAGLTAITFFPLIVFAVLIVSYVSYHKMNSSW